MGTEVTVPVTIRAAAAGAAAAADGANADVMKSWENRPLAALELAAAAASGRSEGCSSGWYFDRVLCRKMMRLRVGLMPASRSFAMRSLMKGYALKTPRRTATIEATAEQAYATIWAVVIEAAASVGTDVPRGQLWEEEQGRQADSDVWPDARA